MGWTYWRKLAEGDEWFDEVFDYDGPACYELGTGGPRGGNIESMYVGETANEKKRMAAYACSGSHLAEIIAKHLRDGWSLYYRAQTKPSKEAAKAVQDRLLEQFDYDWNIRLNT